MAQRRIAVHFPRLGPYHIARIGAAVRALQAIDYEVIGLEVAGSDITYEWRQENQRTAWQRSTIFPNDEFERIPSRRLAAGVKRELDRLRPAAVAICGYATSDARAAARWCRDNGSTAILMTETRKADGIRVCWKEWLKSRLVKGFDSALCGGREHREYLIELGLPADRIHQGYDVIDNEHFATESDRFRHDRNATGGPYFLSSNRFIPRKNLATLITAYSRYANSYTSSPLSCCWPLVLLGDGEQRAALLEQCRDLNLPIHTCAPWDSRDLKATPASPSVFFPGFRQFDELPRFYARAGCFIHPAIAEPWGLVLNEAMASSLPILASTGTGSATDLLQEGLNGWRFDAHQDSVLAALMARIAGMPLQTREKMGTAARQTVEAKCPLSAFGQGLASAIERSGTFRR